MCKGGVRVSGTRLRPIIARVHISHPTFRSPLPSLGRVRDVPDGALPSMTGPRQRRAGARRAARVGQDCFG